MIYKFLLAALEDRGGIEESYELSEAHDGKWPRISFKNIVRLYDYLCANGYAMELHSPHSSKVRTDTVSDNTVKDVVQVNKNVDKKETVENALFARLSPEEEQRRSTLSAEELALDNYRLLYPYSTEKELEKGENHRPSESTFYYLSFAGKQAQIYFHNILFRKLDDIKQLIKKFYLEELHEKPELVDEYMNLWTPATVAHGYKYEKEYQANIHYMILKFNLSDPENIPHGARNR